MGGMRRSEIGMFRRPGGTGAQLKLLPRIVRSRGMVRTGGVRVLPQGSHTGLCRHHGAGF